MTYIAAMWARTAKLSHLSPESGRATPPVCSMVSVSPTLLAYLYYTRTLCATPKLANRQQEQTKRPERAKIRSREHTRRNGNARTRRGERLGRRSYHLPPPEPRPFSFDIEQPLRSTTIIVITASHCLYPQTSFTTTNPQLSSFSNTLIIYLGSY